MAESASKPPAPRRSLSVRWRIVLVGVLSALAALLLGQTSLIKEIEARTLDLLFRFRRLASMDPVTKSPRFIQDNIVLIGITDEDQKELGAWPWPRDLQATMLDAFAGEKTHPRAIGYDVLFFTAKPDKDSQASDAKFSVTLKKLGNVCLAGKAGIESAAGHHGEENALPSMDSTNSQWFISQAILSDGVGENAPFKPEQEIGAPADIFRKSSHLGLINAVRDEDGIHRRMPIVLKEGNHWLPSLSLRLAMLYHRIPLNGVTVHPGQEVILKREDGWQLRIPVEDHEGWAQVMRVNYRGSLRSTDFVYVPFVKALQWAKGESDDPRAMEALEKAHKGIVVIGTMVTGADVGATPLDRGTALVDVHLNMLNTLIRGDFLRSLPFWGIAFLILSLSLIASYSAHKLSAIKSTAVSLGVLLLFFGLTWILFSKQSVVIPLVVPFLGLGLAYTSGTVMQFMGEERQKRQLRKTFQNYLSANVMEEVLKNPAAMEMGGVRKELTVLFTDVRGFTAFCEKNPPEEVVPILNELLEVASEVIAQHDGTLDKYIGDAIMAFWGAPIPQQNHPELAARAALGMRDALAKLQKEWERRGLPSLHLGIGINTGEMVVGNMGSSRLRNYTLIGDEVNLGARLESETRKFDTDIIISESTANRLGKEFKTRYLAEVIVKGKQKPVRIYSLEGVEEKTK